jgi:hypothetical protein
LPRAHSRSSSRSVNTGIPFCTANSTSRSAPRDSPWIRYTASAKALGRASPGAVHGRRGNRVIARSRAIHPRPRRESDRAALLGAALLITLIPFYHGALRHLDEQYAGTAVRGARGFVLVDFLILFLESCLFLALAIASARPDVFVSLFLALLGLDVVWVLLTTRFLTNESDLAPQRMWRNINLIAALGLLIPSFTLGSCTLSYVVLAIATVRTGADYAFTWSFYAAANRSA